MSCMPGSHSKSAEARRSWGCDSKADAPVFADPTTGSFHVSRQFDLHRCPACQTDHAWLDAIATWRVFGWGDTLGPLPVAGGWMDQTQWFADLHRILAGERAKIIAEQVKEANRRNSKG